MDGSRVPSQVAVGPDEHVLGVADQHRGEWWAETVLSLLERVYAAEQDRALLRDALGVAYAFIDRGDAPTTGAMLSTLSVVRHALDETGGHIHPNEVELP